MNLYYRAGPTDIFRPTVSFSRKIIREALEGHSKSSADTSLDLNHYGQAHPEHFLAVSKALDAVRARLLIIREKDYLSERTLYILQQCGRQLSQIEKQTRLVAKRPGPVSNLVFDRIRLLTFTFLQFEIQKSLAVLKNWNYILLTQIWIAVTSFLITLDALIKKHKSPSVIRDVK